MSKPVIATKTRAGLMGPGHVNKLEAKADLVGGRVPATQLPSVMSQSALITNVEGSTIISKYTVPVLLFKNGVKIPAAEYTATDGFTITLTNAAILADEFELYWFEAFQVANLGTAAYASTGNFATIVQGVKADTALQPAVIGTTVQPFDTNIAKTNVDNSWLGAQRFGTLTVLTSAATITISLATGNDYYLVAGTNITLANPSDIATFVGQKGTIACAQDGTGGRTISFGSLWYPIGSATAPTAPAGANNMFRIDYHVVNASRIDYSLSSVGV